MYTKIKRLLEGKEDNYIFPFLWMHGEEEQTLREYMKAIYESNIRAVCVESRPHPDFVGPGWWHDMDIILDEARTRGMKVWILDDSHFPTGYANGALEQADEKLCRQSLVYQIAAMVEGGSTVTISLDEYQKASPWTPNLNESYTMDMTKVRVYDDDRLIGIVAVKKDGQSMEDILDLTDQKDSKELVFCAPEGIWKIYVFHLTRNRGPHRNYINMMNRASCKVLIDTVYEPHYQHYKKYFGTTIAGFFSDEPELGNGHLYESGKRIYQLEDQAWSDEIGESLQKIWGNDFRKYLPLLWEEEFAPQAKAEARYQYMNTVTRAVETDFSMQLGNWCRSHHVEYIGHLIEDNNQHTRTGSSLGHYFRGLAGQDMAGIDDIGGQVLPQGEWNGPYGLMGEERNGEFYHFVLGKLADSMAAVDPLKKGRSMCEIFGNYGWEEGVKLETYLADHFLVRGINHFVPHAFSPKEFPDPDCPPHFYAHGNNPQYRHFGVLMKYINRVCELFSDGRHIAPTAILYNAEAEWTGEYMNLEKPVRILAENQIDYDFVPADIFAEPEKYETKIGDLLQVNGNTYKMLLVPRAQFLPAKTCEAIQRLGGQGCHVVFLEEYPEGTCEGHILPEETWENCSCVMTENLMELMKKEEIPDIALTPAEPYIRYRRYRGESTVYMFVDEGKNPYQGIIHVPEKGTCYRYNAWENKIEKINANETESGTDLQVRIEPGKSLIVVFDETERVCPCCAEDLAEVITDTCKEEKDGWLRSFCTGKEYPHFGTEKEVSVPDQLEKELPEFSGYVRYRKCIRLDEVPERVILEITDAGEAAELFINGESLGIQLTAPFRYDITDVIDAGDNELCIEIATTLERALAKLPDPIRMYMGLGEKQPTCCSGINGHVLLKY